MKQNTIFLSVISGLSEESVQIRLKNLVWAIFFSFREKEKMSLTEKTDIRDSDEKVVEFLPDCNKFI